MMLRNAPIAVANREGRRAVRLVGEEAAARRAVRQQRRRDRRQQPSASNRDPHGVAQRRTVSLQTFLSQVLREHPLLLPLLHLSPPFILPYTICAPDIA